MKIKINTSKNFEQNEPPSFVLNNNGEPLALKTTELIDLKGATPEVSMPFGTVELNKGFSFVVKMEDGTFSAVVLPYLPMQTMSVADTWKKYLGQAEATYLEGLTKATGDPDFVNNNLMSADWLKKSKANSETTLEPGQAAASEVNATSRIFFSNAPGKLVQIAEAIAGDYDIDFTGQQKMTFETTLNQNSYKNSKAQQKVNDVLAKNPSIINDIESLLDATSPTTITNYDTNNINDYGAIPSIGGVSQVIFYRPTIITGGATAEGAKESANAYLVNILAEVTTVLQSYAEQFT